jgi:hypothetical protein
MTDAKERHAVVGSNLGPNKIASVKGLLLGGAVALHAFKWGRFVENYRIPAEQLYLSMALIAGNAFVATAERKLGPFIVIERGGSPSLLRMTIGTGGFSRFGKLSAVWVFMARLASLRCSLKLNLG